MTDPAASTDSLQPLLDEWHRQGIGAREALIAHACGRLRDLARHMLNDFPKLRRWEETDDVLQTAMMRMIRALDEVRPESVRDFLRLASLQIRRQLLDFTRYYYGAEGPGRHHHSVPPGSMNDHRRPASNAPDASDSTWEPQQVAQWTLLHESVERLGSELVEIFDLVWYQGLPLVEAARLLGISERTAQRRWQLVRIELSEQLDNQLPGI